MTRTQARNGHWEAEGGLYPVAMTSLAGMALLMEGSTAREGRHANAVRSACSHLLGQVRPNGLIGHPDRDSRYMYGHGFAMLFLSQLVGEEEDEPRRREILTALRLAVDFTGRAQTPDGGWGYLSALEGGNFDEGSVTVTQMQGLRGCLDAGVRVPEEIVAKGIRYIEACTDVDGGVRYSLQTRGPARPPITAAAIACLFHAGQHDHPLAAKLARYADRSLAPEGEYIAMGHWHYAHYYHAQVVYRQGGDRWQAYRDRVFPRLLEQQSPDGSWNDGLIGPAYTTSLVLAILQLDNASLPIHQR